MTTPAANVMPNETAQQQSDINALLAALETAENSVNQAGSQVNSTIQTLASWTGPASGTYKGALDTWVQYNKQIVAAIQDIIDNLTQGTFDLASTDEDNQQLATRLVVPGTPSTTSTVGSILKGGS